MVGAGAGALAGLVGRQPGSRQRAADSEPFRHRGRAGRPSGRRQVRPRGRRVAGVLAHAPGPAAARTDEDAAVVVDLPTVLADGAVGVRDRVPLPAPGGGRRAAVGSAGPSVAIAAVMEESLKLVPLAIIAFLAPGRARRFAATDWALLGLASGMGFQAAEDMVRRVALRPGIFSLFFERDDWRYGWTLFGGRFDFRRYGQLRRPPHRDGARGRSHRPGRPPRPPQGPALAVGRPARALAGRGRRPRRPQRDHRRPVRVHLGTVHRAGVPAHPLVVDGSWVRPRVAACRTARRRGDLRRPSPDGPIRCCRATRPARQLVGRRQQRVPGRSRPDAGPGRQRACRLGRPATRPRALGRAVLAGAALALDARLRRCGRHPWRGLSALVARSLAVDIGPTCVHRGEPGSQAYSTPSGSGGTAWAPAVMGL